MKKYKEKYILTLHGNCNVISFTTKHLLADGVLESHNTLSEFFSINESYMFISSEP
jgi:hypothetical protein